MRKRDSRWRCPSDSEGGPHEWHPKKDEPPCYFCGKCGVVGLRKMGNAPWHMTKADKAALREHWPITPLSRYVSAEGIERFPGRELYDNLNARAARNGMRKAGVP